MSTVDVQELPNSLPAIMARVEAGEEVGIQRDGIVFATLAPIAPYPGMRFDLPSIGFLKGHIVVPDNFKDLGQDEIRSMFCEVD